MCYVRDYLIVFYCFIVGKTSNLTCDTCVEVPEEGPRCDCIVTRSITLVVCVVGKTSNLTCDTCVEVPEEGPKCDCGDGKLWDKTTSTCIGMY